MNLTGRLNKVRIAYFPHRRFLRISRLGVKHVVISLVKQISGVLALSR